MEFLYKARRSDGKVDQGRVEADDRTDALAQLEQQGLLVSELTEKKVLTRRRLRTVRSRRLALKDLATFCSQFSTLLGAGVPVLEALSLIAQQFRGKRLAAILEQVLIDLKSGQSLSQALRAQGDSLPSPLIYITAVGEVTGRLDEGYGLLAQQFELEEKMAGKVKSAMIYPSVVLSVAFGVVIFMLTYVLPQYAALFRQMGADLPGATLVLMAVGRTVQDWWFLILPSPFLLIWAGSRLLKVPRVLGAYQRLLLRIPVVGTLRHRREMGRFCRTLGSMVQGGVPLLSALESVHAASEFLPLRASLAPVIEQIRSGEGFGTALKSQPFFDALTVEILALGEASGNLEAMLFKVATTAEQDVGLLLERLTNLLEPVMTILLGSIILMIIVPMVLPMFDILNQVK